MKKPTNKIICSPAVLVAGDVVVLGAGVADLGAVGGAPVHQLEAAVE